MKVVVIDGKGGGIGSQIVERLKALKSNDLEIIALGTNSQATINMLRAGANDGATGENAIVCMSKKADIIVGPMAIIAANSMMGDISPKMAEAVASSDAKKLLLPISKCNFEIVGLENYQLKQLFDELIEKIKEYIDIK